MKKPIIAVFLFVLLINSPGFLAGPPQEKERHGQTQSPQHFKTDPKTEDRNGPGSPSPSSKPSTASPLSERDALIALYKSTRGDSWLNNSGWKTPPLHSDGFAQPGTENTWFGVTCDPQNTTVTSIKLTNNNLTGPIPRQLGNLRNLQRLLLGNNQLIGPIPIELGQLVNLQDLWLGGNHLTGTIPAQLKNLSKLLRLWLFDNHLEGPIPRALGNLTSLTLLNLRGNRLTGKLPNQLYSLVNLLPQEGLDLRWNAVFTDNHHLQTFLNAKQIGGDWEGTQTIAPTNVTAVSTSYTSIRVTWDTIPYSGAPGGYSVFYATTPDDSFTLAGTTQSKQVSQIEVSDLTPGTTYYFVIQTRTEPHSGNKNTVESDFSAQFSASTPALSLPTVTTIEVTDIITDSASCRGEVTHNGGTPVVEKGHCWSSDGLPTILDSRTIDGSGIGPFTSSITGLEPGVTYQARAYAVNATGTAYGAPVTFTTLTHPIISGVIHDGNDPVPGVTLTFSNGGGSTVTNSDGSYEHTVNYQWQGTVTPSKTGFDFAPKDKAYETVITNWVDQDYTAIPSEAPTYSITGTVATEEGTGLAGIVLEFAQNSTEDNTGNSATTAPQYTYTDEQGHYEFEAEAGWNGTVTPSGEGYSFQPQDRPIKDLQENREEQNFTASTVPPVISGRVSDSEKVGVSGVIITFTGSGASSGDDHEFSTDINGNYSAEVPHNWTGEAKPTKTGYEFDPPSHSYENLTSGKTDQNYLVSAVSPVISGTVTFGSGQTTMGLAGVQLSFTSAEPLSTDVSYGTTDANGHYKQAVENGWSGTVKPSKTGYTFFPENRPYENVTADQAEVNFSATAILPVISGRVSKPEGTGLPGVKIFFQPAQGSAHSSNPGTQYTYSDDNGNFSLAVDYHWTGTLTPSKARYQFKPVSLPIQRVFQDIPNQDFDAVPVGLFVAGKISRPDGEGQGDVILQFSNSGGNIATGENGKYVHTVPYLWSGQVTPQKDGFRFNPTTRQYDAISTNQIDQYYVAEEILLQISGRVSVSTSNGIEGLPGVQMVFTGDGDSPDLPTVPTDAAGTYVHKEVPRGWTGTVKPKKENYHFSPPDLRIRSTYFNRSRHNFSAGKSQITLRLEATRKVERSLTISTHYGQIKITLVEVIGNIPVHYYRLYKQASTSGNTEEFPIPNLQIGKPFHQNDRNIEKNTSYRYVVRAFDANNNIIGESNEEII